MKRDYFLYTADGKQQLAELDIPIQIGGGGAADITIPALGTDKVVAIIAQADGHTFIQPEAGAITIYHNNERLLDSVWLKSGDRIQIADCEISWDVKGDRVIIRVRPQAVDIPVLRPPVQAPISKPTSQALPVTVKPHLFGKGKGLSRLVIALISVLVLLAAYLLAATTVTVSLEPANAKVQLQGFPPAIHLAGSRLVFPGQYQLTATATGYAPLNKPVEILWGSSQALDFSLAELPGQVHLQLTPEVSAQVLVDEVEVQPQAQGAYSIERGKHLFSVLTDRYLPKHSEFEVAGFGAEQNLELELERAWAVVNISSQPPAAEILLDNETLGYTPMAAEILQGSHELKIQMPGFKPVIQFHEILAAKDFSIDSITLEPVDGHLILTSKPTGANILVDDKFLGTTPKSLPLAAEMEHQLSLSKVGYITSHQGFNLQPDEERELNVNLAAEYGTVFLKTTPAGVTVTINGKVSKQNNGRIRLQTRKNTLKVSKKGYITQQLIISPRAGVSQNINIDLLSVQQRQVQQKAAATPPIMQAPDGSKLTLIRANGQLKMGASRREAGRRANESQRLVVLKRPFYLGQKEITNTQYRQFDPAKNSGSAESTQLNGEQQPVVNISWDDAARYCNWLSQKQGLPLAYQQVNGKMQAIVPINTGYRLPTEAEWAWAARKQGAVSERRYPWVGRFPPTSVSGNYADASIADTLVDVVPGYNDGYRVTAPVASFPASAGGFYDLGGNVAEWMHDYYAVYPGESAQQVTDPAGPASGSHHVVRGSSWREGSISELRLSYRDYSNKPRDDLGFRIARYAE